MGDSSSPTRARISIAIVVLDADELPPIVTWGTSPEQVVSVSGRVPEPDEIADETKRKAPSARSTIWA